MLCTWTLVLFFIISPKISNGILLVNMFEQLRPSPYKFPVQGRVIVSWRIIGRHHVWATTKYAHYTYTIACVDDEWHQIKKQTFRQQMEFYRKHYYSISDHKDHLADWNMYNYTLKLECNRYEGLVVLIMMPINGDAVTVKFYDNECLFADSVFKEHLNYDYNIEISARCVKLWWGKYCHRFCIDFTSRSRCRYDGTNMCLTGFTGLERKVEFYFRSLNDEANEYKKKADTHIYRECDYPDLCSDTFCSKSRCIQFSKQSYFCEDWLKPTLANKGNHFSKEEKLVCQFQSNLSSLAPVVVKMKPTKSVRVDSLHENIGYVVGDAVVANVTCESTALGKKYTSTRLIYIRPSLKVCEIHPKSTPHIIRYVYYDTELRFIAPVIKNSAQKVVIGLSFSYKSGLNNILINGSSIRFLQGAVPGTYIVSCSMYFDTKTDKQFVKSQHVLALVDKNYYMKLPLRKIVFTSSRPNLPETLDKTTLFNQLVNCFKNDMKNYSAKFIYKPPLLLQTSDTEFAPSSFRGAFTTKCEYQNIIPGSIPFQRDIYIESYGLATDADIDPNSIHPDVPIHCLHDAYPPYLGMTVWTVLDQMYFADVLILGDIGLKYTYGRKLTVKCGVVFQGIEIASAMMTSVYEEPIQRFHFIEQRRSTSRSMKYFMCIVAILSPFISLILILIFFPLLNRDEDSADLLNYNFEEKLFEVVRRSRKPPVVDAPEEKEKDKKKKDKKNKDNY